MKNLTLLLTVFILVSCGRVSIPLFEKHDDDHDKKQSVGVRTASHISLAIVSDCNIRAVNMNWTRQYVTGRLLQPNEVYNQFCWQQYNMCLNRL